LTAGATLQVPTNGLYHVIVDMDNNTIIIAPVDWGVNIGSGIDMEAGAFSKTSMTFTLENVEKASTGTFKYRYGNGWKIELSDGVKVNTNLGKDGGKLVPGGTDIPIERGVYTIKLTWTLAGGEISNSFTDNVTLTEELPTLNPADFVYSLIGDAIGGWGAGDDIDFAFVSKEGNNYTYEVENVTFGAGEFKVRFDHDWGKNFGLGTEDGNVFSLVNNGGNIASPNATISKVQFTFEWDEEDSVEVNPTLTLVP